MSVRRPVPCPVCHGTGRQGLRACTRCTGTGTIEERETLKVKIPPGIADGARVRVRGKGGVGLDGAPGDLYFRVKIRPHPLIQRDGNDLTCKSFFKDGLSCTMLRRERKLILRLS